MSGGMHADGLMAALRARDPGRADTRWMDDAACRDQDPEWFFPVVGIVPKKAKAVCARCPVLAECGAYADAEGIRYGVWGGEARGGRPKGRRRPAKAAAG